MEAEKINQIKQQSTSGVIFLTIRNLGIQAVSVIGFFILTLILGPADVGLFAIVSESVSLLGYFSDLGLAAALIQTHRRPSLSQLRSTFAIQQILVVLSIILVSLVYRQIYFYKSYGHTETIIFVSLCFSYFTASLKTIPSVLLERKLNFPKLSIIDVVENLIFYLVAVIFALLGFGPISYAFAIIIRSILGLALIYHYQSWPIGFAFSLSAIKGLFTFGIPYQLNSLIAMAKDRMSNLLVAGIIGRESFGLLSWAQKAPRLPLSLMDSVIRVTFPVFSRLQRQPRLLASSLQKTTFFIAFFIFPVLAGISLVAADFINLIPKYSKWTAALLPLYIYCFNFSIASITTPFTNAFNAIGKITTTTKFMIMWTVLTWIFFPILSLKFNYIGTAIASLLVSSSSFLVWHSANRIFGISTLRLIIHPLLATAIFTVIILALNPVLPLKIIIAILIYFIYHFLFSRSQINWLITQIKCHLSKKLS